MRWISLAAMLAMGSLVVGCGGSPPGVDGGGGGSAGGGGSVPGDGTGAPDIAAEGEPAPSFSLTDTDGVTRTLRDMLTRGPVVLFFFCPT
jgi:hypothetical protein